MGAMLVVGKGYIFSAPTINPVKHGRWIQISTSDNEYVGMECSVCNEVQYGFDNFRNYCANCGAKMDMEG